MRKFALALRQPRHGLTDRATCSGSHRVSSSPPPSSGSGERAEWPRASSLASSTSSLFWPTCCWPSRGAGRGLQPCVLCPCRLGDVGACERCGWGTGVPRVERLARYELTSSRIVSAHLGRSAANQRSAAVSTATLRYGSSTLALSYSLDSSHVAMAAARFS